MYVIPTALPAYWAPQLASDQAVIYALNSEFRLIWCNEAWDQFARENGGLELLGAAQIGVSVMAVTPAPLQAFYAGLYRRALNGEDFVEHSYECSSDETFRIFHMQVKRMKLPESDPFLVVVNSLNLEESIPHSAALPAPTRESLRQASGLITMCCHCRRTQIPGSENTWVWIPDLVREMPDEATHGICPTCFSMHYGS